MNKLKRLDPAESRRYNINIEVFPCFARTLLFIQHP